MKERQNLFNHSSEPAGTPIQQQGRIQVLVIQWLQAHITLFSKYFASFPHGTCSLSDSRRYLALDEIYHLIYVPIPGNVTLRSRTLRSTAQALNWAVTIRCILFQKTYACRTTSNASRYYNAKPDGLAFRYELLFLHSPLLEESFDVLIPPLTYMLKFRG